MDSQGGTMRDCAAYRGFMAPLLVLGSLVGDMPTARAQQPAPAAQFEGPASPARIAVEAPRRPRRPPLDPAARELRQTRGMLAGGIALTTLCSVGFGLVTYVVVDRWGSLHGASGSRTFAAGGAMLACMVVSIAAIGVSGKRLRALERPRRVAWAGGSGLRF